jgi:predicted dehydrogenase
MVYFCFWSEGILPSRRRVTQLTLIVGQIGAAPQVADHLRAYVDSPYVDSVVLADADEQARDRLYARFGIIKQVHDDPQAVLDDPDVSVVDIYTPTAACSSLAVAALEAGKHVICAAPPARSAAEWERMIATANRVDRRLLIAIPECIVPANQKAEQILADGELGRVMVATALVVSGSSQDGPAPLVTDSDRLLYGCIAVLERWLGPTAMVSVTVADDADSDRGSALQTALVNLQMTAGAVAQVAVSIGSEEARATAERRIVGTTGQLLIRDDSEDEIPIIGMQGRAFYPIAVHNPPFIMQYATAQLLSRFIECMVTQSEPPVTLEQAGSALATLLAIDESRRSGQSVRLT